MRDRYFVRFMCMRLDSSFDIHEDTFATESEIRVWANLHSYTDVATKIKVDWAISYVYDREEKKDITSKFC